MQDDETAVYILEVRRTFEDLRQVAAQLAGLLVLTASGSKCSGPDHPLLRVAEDLHAAAADSLHAARVTMRAREHHSHLLLAAADLRIALTGARFHLPASIDPAMVPLRAAYRHLQRAANSLPGFTMVALDHACCAVSLPHAEVVSR